MRVDGAGELEAGEIKSDHSASISGAANADPVAGR